MRSAHLELRSVHVAFAGSDVLRGLDLSLLPGEAKCLVGPNGSGKTTLFNVVAGTVRPLSGDVRVSGADISSWTPQARARFGLIRSFQIPRLSPNLTALDHLLVATRRLESLWLRGVGERDSPKHREFASGILDEFGFDGAHEMKVEDMSHGQRKLLDVACAFAAKPHILLLDEPAAGIDEAHKELLVRAIGRRASVVTMVLIEHDMEFVERFEFPIVFLNEGRILCEGSLADIRARPEASRVYF